jgi:murein DD-endopeptidase MepM/ murein hydrolase activator NlpD
MAYVNNNAVNYTDPTGNATCTDDGRCFERQNIVTPSKFFVNNMRLPTNGGTVGTKFGAFNTVEDPSESPPSVEDYQEYGAHAAVDINSPETNDIYAVYSGVIVEARDRGNNGGYRITIEHEVMGEKFYSYYFHLAKFEEADYLGKEVMRGDVIGQMGSTGSPYHHLHFEVRTQAGYDAKDYWANSTEELNKNWVDISSRFGGHDANLPEDY